MSMPFQVFVGPFLELTHKMTREEQNNFFEKFEDRLYLPESHDTVLLPNKDVGQFTGNKYDEPTVHHGARDSSIQKNVFLREYVDIMEYFGSERCRVSWGIVTYFA